MRTRQLIVLPAMLVSVLCVAAATCFAQHTQTGLLGQGQPWETPYYIQDSGVDGPTVVVTGGIHGNEPAGARAAEQIRHWPIVQGKLIVVPRVNTASLREDVRFLPGASKELRDLNRNFPSPGTAAEPRGDIARELWRFVVAQDPDWLFDLHEGYDFNISHQPKAGKSKSVGSSIIYNGDQDVDDLVQGMLAAANATVTDEDRRFVLLGRGPKKTTLAAAAIDVLGAKAMILETTFRHQRLSVRTRQHREMMNVALGRLGLIQEDCVDVLTPPADQRSAHAFVALYDDKGGSANGVDNLTQVFDEAGEMTVVHLGADQIRPDVLSQFDVVVFGGGSGSKEAAAIGEDGAEAVRSFVRDGGGYVGVCAGAYLCSAHYSWSLDLIDTHVFTGTREIEGVGPKSMWYRGKSSLQKMQLTAAGQRLFGDIAENVEVRYHNGPIVSPKNDPGLKPYQVLAWFRSEIVRYAPQEGTMVDTPAIVSGPFGKGRVISISPHPEATAGLETMLATAVKAAAARTDSPATADSAAASPPAEGPSAEDPPAEGSPAEGSLEAFLGEPELSIQQVFENERFPNIVVTSRGTIVATWGRPHIRAKRSEDGGRTWGEEITIADGGIHGGGTTVDESTGDLLAFVEEEHPPAPLAVYRSQDDGKSWQAEPVTIRPDSQGRRPSMHMNERGITLRHGQHAGRLIRASRFYGKGNRPESLWPTHFTNAIYSDDGGKTWQTSEPFPENGTGEAAIAELSDGRLYYNSRRHWAPEGKNPLRRWTAYSDDGGATWKDGGICKVLPDGPQDTNYGCMAGLVRLPIRGRDILVYSNCDSPSGRHHGTVWASFDGGQTWPLKRLVHEGDFAYSSLAAGRPGTPSEGMIYLHFESDGSKVARFNLSWLLGGKPTGDGTVPEQFAR
ncbi:exo-alpha-sialidase [Roseimaritima sediminicola]|uniref:exo-alpha-sialidase n=1 Tax=Roseimaritima sediminicola TaxID=2662066 RepID=UPI00129850E5|nr:exo-alpha-sialidase [Roseimaritima sediminicola]